MNDVHLWHVRTSSAVALELRGVGVPITGDAIPSFSDFEERVSVTGTDLTAVTGCLMLVLVFFCSVGALLMISSWNLFPIPSSNRLGPRPCSFCCEFFLVNCSRSFLMAKSRFHGGKCAYFCARFSSWACSVCLRCSMSRCSRARIRARFHSGTAADTAVSMFPQFPRSVVSNNHATPNQNQCATPGHLSNQKCPTDGKLDFVCDSDADFFAA